MTAEIVLLENLKKLFEENQQLIDATNNTKLEKLKTSLTNAKFAMVALQQRNESAAAEVMEAIATSEERKAVSKLKDEKALADLETDPDDNKLNNLGALQYKADDLLDEILTCYNGSRLRGGYPWLGRIAHFFSSQHPLELSSRLVRRVATTTQKIEELVKQLQNSFNNTDQPQKEFEIPPPVTLAEKKVIGRNPDRDRIIEMLLQPKIMSKTNVTVIPIVGSPGLGKSTLAKYVYDDARVHNHFDLKIWIRVSQIIDEEEIVREIVESCTNRKSNYIRFPKQANISHNSQSPFCRNVLGCQNFGTAASPPSATTNIDIYKHRLQKEMNEIDISESQFRKEINKIHIFESKLKKEIKNKLFLLVVDDASIKGWNYLKQLLAKGARGSHILVTTRFLEVANLSKTESVEPYKLDGLEVKYSWSLFKTFTFGKDDPGEDSWSLFNILPFVQEGPKEQNQRKEIGKSIVHKCKGVPLTIKVAASFLHGKEIDQWSSFNESLSGEAHNIMNQVLHFSYTDLPARLKVCFTYCSLFPENYIFNKRDLLSLWASQGFIDQQQVQSLEEAAENYFNALFQRCFFEDATTDELGNILTCKMHPIMRNLAYQHAAGAINMHVADSSVRQVPDLSCKHVSFTCVENSSIKIAPSFLHTRKLRTLLYVKEEDFDIKMDTIVCNMLISSFKYLRVLDLHDLQIERLPDSIGKLYHLRYLDLSQNDLVTLPKSVTHLYNLQSLKLNSCMRLIKLPGNFGQLINLKRFEVDKCDKLTSMPLGLERLTQLETLSRFIVSKDCSIELGTLRNLKSLRGRLAIELSGEWAANIPEDSRVELQLSEHIKELKISWARIVQQKKSYQDLLEKLQPPKNLKILCIEGYKGDYFPSWVKGKVLASLSHLEVVSIEGCGKCQHLPPFSELKNLKRLTLRHMANVQYVEPETPAGGNEESNQATPFFPSLIELILHNFNKLEGWRKAKMITSQKQEEIRSFPPLTKLQIWNCPKLKSMPLFTQVSDLDLRNVNQTLLTECAKKVPRAKSNSEIKKLQIKGCSDLENFTTVREGLGGLPSLKQLVVERCDALCLLASELKYLTSLDRLEISSCKNLDLSDDRTSITDNSSTMSNIASKISKNPWTSLICLGHLTLQDIPKMKNLPNGLKNVRSLRSLWILGCPDLKELPEWISNLNTLQHLRIENCHGLKKLPYGIQEVKSLLKLEITECPDLMKRCKVHTGKDWDKIKHAWVVLHKSWRYGLKSEKGASQKISNVQETNDAKFYMVPNAEPPALIPLVPKKKLASEA